MKHTTLTLGLLAGIGFFAQAARAEAHDGTHQMPDGTTMHNHEMGTSTPAKKTAPVTASRKVVATVNGLVCDFCVQSIQKTLLKEPGVSEAHVDLSAKTVTVGLKDGATLEEARLGKLLKDAGYDMVSYKTE